MSKQRYLKTMLFYIFCTILLHLFAAAEGYTLKDILYGLLPVQSHFFVGITTNLLSSMRWIWGMLPPVVQAGVVLMQEKQETYLKIYRFKSFKMWFLMQMKQLIIGTLSYLMVLLVSTSFEQRCINVQLIICIGAVGLHIWMLVSILFFFIHCKLNSLYAFFGIIIVESSLIMIGKNTEGMVFLNPALWPMYVRWSLVHNANQMVYGCLTELFISVLLICRIIYKKKHSGDMSREI